MMSLSSVCACEGVCGVAAEQMCVIEVMYGVFNLSMNVNVRKFPTHIF